MTPDSHAQLTTLNTMLSDLVDALHAQSVSSNSNGQKEALKDVLELVSYYRTTLEAAMQANDVAGALRAANGAVGVNKGLADQGAWIAKNSEVRSRGIAVSNKGLDCAKLLRAELGLSY